MGKVMAVVKRNNKKTVKLQKETLLKYIEYSNSPIELLFQKYNTSINGLTGEIIEEKQKSLV